MDLAISDVRPSTDREWDNIWQNCDYATYFHSREWALLWQKYTKGKMNSAAMLITFTDGALALLPFSCNQILMGLIRQYVSSPAGTFGGWLSLDSLSENHGKLLYEYIIANHRNLLWRLNPYDPIVMSIKVDISEQDETQALSLDHGFDAIYRVWTKGHASAARKAQRAGVKIREAVPIQDWKDYYGVYKDSIKRWGVSASSFYEWFFFQSMFEFSSPDIRLWLATYHDRIVSGAICLYAKKHVVYWHGAALSSYFNLRPVNLLLYEIIRDACAHGYQWFDFNPSGGHDGTERFKKSFGTAAWKCPVIHRKSKLVMLANRIRGR